MPQLMAWCEGASCQEALADAMLQAQVFLCLPSFPAVAKGPNTWPAYGGGLCKSIVLSCTYVTITRRSGPQGSMSSFLWGNAMQSQRGLDFKDLICYINYTMLFSMVTAQSSQMLSNVNCLNAAQVPGIIPIFPTVPLLWVSLVPCAGAWVRMDSKIITLVDAGEVPGRHPIDFKGSIFQGHHLRLQMSGMEGTCYITSYPVFLPKQSSCAQ